jgi:phage regulator Rha-like protein
MRRPVEQVKRLVRGETIEQRIYLIRGHRVMLSMHLAELYGVEPRVLIQAVKRNRERFPSDFMFQMTWEEASLLKSQFVTSRDSSSSLRSQNVILKRGQHVKYPPYAFTEQGVAMLSSVLRSRRAVQVNIAIMRAFVKLRETLALHKELAKKLEELEQKIIHHDAQIQSIFDAIRRLMAPPEKPQGRIGFH